MTDVYKIRPDLMRERFDDAAAKLGSKPMLATFVESTRKIVAVPGNYRRFGPYWWAVKAVLKNNGVDLGTEDCDWLRDEYAVKSPKGAIDQESTLLAAWIFAEDNTFVPEIEFEIEGQVWIIDDSDMG
ncbi:hypothetical protein BH10PSE16_BH10PSE16_00740 [soil metagenome]